MPDNTRLPLPAVVWIATTEGDNMPLETTVHRTLKEAEDRVRTDLAQNCPERQRAHLATLTGRDLITTWRDVFDGAIIIESHELAAPQGGK